MTGGLREQPGGAMSADSGILNFTGWLSMPPAELRTFITFETGFESCLSGHGRTSQIATATRAPGGNGSTWSGVFIRSSHHSQTVPFINSGELAMSLDAGAHRRATAPAS